MLAGELYFAADPELVGLRKNAARLTRLYNATTEEEGDLRSRLLQELFGTLGEKATIEPPFRCDYGLNIHSGDRLYLNYNCIILDCCEVRIGNDVMLGGLLFVPVSPLANIPPVTFSPVKSKIIPGASQSK